MCLHSSSYAMRYQIKFSLFKDIANLGSMYPYDVSTLYIWNRDYKKRVLRIILCGLAWIFSKSSTKLPLVNCSTFRVVNSSPYVWFLGFFIFLDESHRAWLFLSGCPASEEFGRIMVLQHLVISWQYQWVLVSIMDTWYTWDCIILGKHSCYLAFDFIST